MWTKNTLEAALDRQIPNRSFNSITIDSRKINLGDVFVGIKGEKFDGNHFSVDAINRGASICITNFLPEHCNVDQFVIVDDTYQDGLTKLATYKRNSNNAVFIGVTGSVGKTTTKEMLKLVLGDAYANEGNLNNQYGLPLSLANMDNSKFGIFELGMSAPGEISYLSTTLKPHIAIITGIAPAHLEYFASVNDIAAAKSEIIDGLLDNGFLIVNFDSPSLDVILKIAQNKKVIGYSSKGHSQAQVELIKSEIVVSNNELFSNICAKYTTLDGKYNEINYKIRSIGNDLISNSLGVLATLVAQNLDVEMMNRLECFEVVNGRGKIYHIETIDLQLIDESYNSNPTSLAAALHRMDLYSQSTKYKHKIAVLGDMLELGKDEMQLHQEVVNSIQKYEIDDVITVGERMHSLHDVLDSKAKIAHFKTSSDVAAEIHKFIKSGDVVMVKGSNSMKMSIICDAIKNIYKL